MSVDFTKMNKRGDLGWGMFEAEDGTIWKRAGVDGNYTYYGGGTEEELNQSKKARERDKQNKIKHKERLETFSPSDWLLYLLGLKSSNVKDKNMPTAHENIDNEIMLNSLNRISQSSHGNWMEGLYKGTTKGGEERYIHRTQPRYPNEDAWKEMTMNLNQQIRENPSFADTLSQSNLPGVRKRMVNMSKPGIIERFISKVFG